MSFRFQRVSVSHSVMIDFTVIAIIPRAVMCAKAIKSMARLNRLNSSAAHDMYTSVYSV